MLFIPLPLLDRVTLIEWDSVRLCLCNYERWMVSSVIVPWNKMNALIQSEHTISKVFIKSIELASPSLSKYSHIIINLIYSTKNRNAR